jgi:hypothetical protein
MRKKLGVFFKYWLFRLTPAMSVTSEKAAEGLGHWEPSKGHDDIVFNNFVHVWV